MKEGPVRHRVLGIGRDGGRLAELDPLLANCHSELYLAPTPEIGLEMFHSLGSVDLVVVEYPVAGWTLTDFEAAMKRSGPGAVRLAVLVRRQDLKSIASTAQSDLVLLPFERSVDEVCETLWRLLETAPRVPVQLMVRLELTSEQRTVLRLAQTENISKTGMLLRTHEELPEDVTVGFGFYIPDDSHPISGAASVVRTTEPQNGSPEPGVAIRFLSLLGSDQLRLERFISRAAAVA